MSKNISLKIYNIDDVNKKIIKKSPRRHSEFDYVGSNNIYRDADYEIYKQKRKEFYQAAKQYRDLNNAALSHNKVKLDVFSDGILTFPPECECDYLSRKLRCTEAEPNLNGLRIKKRSERKIHEKKLKKFEACYIEPWFRKYLILCKFINAARKIIYKNRLLKNLKILNELDEDTIDDIELQYKKYDNVTYPEIFEKFLKN